MYNYNQIFFFLHILKNQSTYTYAVIIPLFGRLMLENEGAVVYLNRTESGMGCVLSAQIARSIILNKSFFKCAVLFRKKILEPV